MPSLFSRARTNSTPQKNILTSSPVSLDEFGRTQSRNSNRASPFASTSAKKDKKKAKDLAKRGKTLDLVDADLDQQQPTLPDGSFLPLNLDPPRNYDTEVGEQARETDYGYLSYERHVVLGLEQLEMLVSVVAEELENRGGITTPFIFSTTALDISASAIKRLIRSFLNVCAGPGADVERAWREEARFAGPHELGMCLRWGLARVVRVSGGQDVRGLVSWDIYLRFRDAEAANGYPTGQFEAFLDELEPTLQVIVVRLLSLLTRLTANSTSSGHTPPTLSPLFGPLLFGLGPATLAFHHTYIHYLRAVNAAEHLLLAFIRWQDTPRLATSSSAMYPSASAAALGVPIRLKEWIKGYPAMLPFLHEHKNVKPHARKGAKTVTVTTVRRNVRMYSPDLVKTAATWAHRSRASNNVINGLASSKEWDRIAPTTLKLPPRYSETYKKRMNLPRDFHPETAPGSYSRSNNTSASSQPPALASTLTIGTLPQPPDKDYFGLGKREGEDRFRSLTDLKWGEFEDMGFNTTGDEKKLQFDLTESAREARAAKRQTMSWNDFSSAGFSRTDAPLNATLQFSTPLTLSVTNWPNKDAELTKKIKKTEKQLPPFGWDTGPVMGSEEIIEESFVDVFCDLIYGGGWMDLERGEGLDRDVNWALVEFKSLPAANRGTVGGGSDPRTSTSLILFEEFVPLEYRQQLAVKSTTRRRLPALFSPSKKQWKQAATLNGRPYVVGHVPRSPSYREMEFEGLLQGGSGTKVISLGSKASTRVVSAISTTTAGHGAGDVPKEPSPPVPPLPAQLSQSQQGGAPPSTPVKKTLAHNTLPRLAATQSQTRSDELHSATSESTATMSPSAAAAKKSSASRFKITNVISSAVSPSPKRLSMVPPAEYSEVQFETRLASYSDSEHNSPDGDAKGKKGKRESRDDAWVDILVNSQSRRMVGQDVELPTKPAGGDPDMASMEVAQVLAAVRGGRNRSSSSLSLGSMSSRERSHRRRFFDDGGEEDGDDGEFASSHRPHGGHRDVSVREHGPSIDMDAHVEGLEIDEIERVPRERQSVESESSLGHHAAGTRGLAYDADDEELESQDLSHSHADHEPSVLEQEHEQEQGQEQESSGLSVRHALKQQRRLGYFDLHPERKQLYSPEQQQRPSPGTLDLTDDIHLQPHQASAASYGSPSPDVPSFDSSIEKRRAEMEKSGLARADSVTLPSTKSSSENGHGQQTNGHASAGAVTPTPVAIIPPVATTVTPPVSVTLSPSVHPMGPRAPASSSVAGTGVGVGAGAGTKTAALIEMYRERERRAAAAPSITATTATPASTTTTPPPAVPVPSLPTIAAPAAATPSTVPSIITPLRVPARSASLPGATNPNSNITPVSVPVPAPAEIPPAPATAPAAVELIEPPKVLLEETGRASPGRYIHGAPLHNVLEEEEEEDL
ncbi:hypothetical protein D9756_010316 [Leucocoprinus leucothites]|uniref:Meiotically up-regulated protein Msb1/Mug8 domain-containing protein n=1 Tax=Leucocoprinus leucothites TaxID=201217 RepID=A0A8H5FT39_9AGAR|nr:hypothetical protein D9756_010316 [Leucoagaricus leucothites]